MDINLTLIGQMFSFAILVGLVMQYGWPRLIAALDARAKQIADGLTAAELGQQKLSDADKYFAERVNAAKSQSAAILDQAEKRASQIVDEAKNKAKTEGQRIIDSAKSEIAKELEATKAALRQEVSAIALAGARQILKREIDSKTNQSLLDALAKEI